MIKEVLNYNNILEELPEKIKNSDYKTEYFIKKLQIPTATFYRKLRNNSFTPKEVLNLAKIINPEEYLDYMLESSRKDKEQGYLYTREEVRKLMTKNFINR